MKKIKFSPSIIDEDGELMFEGSIEVNIPKRHERLGVAFKKMEIDQALEDDEIKPLEAVKKKLELLESAAVDHFVSMDLTHIKSGTKIKSLDDLEYFEEGNALINEIGTKAINGVRLGNVQN